MKNKIIKERFEKAKLLFENKNFVQLEMGTAEYSNVLERIMNDLKKVKDSLRTRSREGARHRKEADRIQSAINAMKYLRNKNSRMITSSNIRENKNKNFGRDDIKNFIKTFK